MEKIRTGLVLVLVLLGGAFLGATQNAVADHTDGNLYDWTGTGAYVLQQGAVSNHQITVCSSVFPSSTATAWGRWNSALSNLGLFASSCSSPNVTVQTSTWSTYCDSGSHACTLPTNVDVANYAIVNPTYISVKPGTWSDGDSHLTRDITHELGHVLGFAHACSLMDGSESAGCWAESPTSLDTTYYHNAYHPDAVSSLSGSGPSAGTVRLTWNASSVHNEADFDVWRHSCSTCTDWVWVGNLGKDYNLIQVGGQPSGTWYYAVWSRSYADYQHFIWGDVAQVAVSIP